MTYRSTSFGIFVAIMAALAGPTTAATYYVSPTGNDSSTQPTNVSTPLYTLNAAVTLAKPGDTITMRGGTYLYTSTQTISCSGTTTNLITVHNYSQENPKIDGSQLPVSTRSVMITGSNLSIAGIEVLNSKNAGIQLMSAHGVSISHCSSHNNWQAGILAKGNNITDTTNITVDHCTIYANGQINAARNSSSWPGALMTQGASQVTFSNNTVYQNYGEGIIFNLCNAGHAFGNVVRDNFSVEFYLDNATNCIVEKNLLYSTLNANYYRNGYPANGIQYANEHYWIQNYSDADLIKNNIVLNGRFGFMYSNYGMAGGLRDTKVINNTFYNSVDTGLLINPDAGHTNSYICNNIFYQTGTRPLAYSGGGGTIWYFQNVWYGGNGNNGSLNGTGDLWSDPKLVNPGGVTAADYALQSTSPAINAGSNDADVLDDYFSYTRTNNDIGAVEFH